MGKLEEAILNGLKNFMELKSGEAALIVIDEDCRELGYKFKEAAEELTDEVMLIEMKTRLNDGAPLPKVVAEAMKAADVVVGVTKMSMTHTQARHDANKAGTRVGTLPNVVPESLERCLSCDKDSLVSETDRITEILTKGKLARLTTPNGTDLTIPIDGIEAISSTGVIKIGGKGANLLSGEAFLMPEEGKTNGVVVVDGTISQVGLMHDDYVKIKIEDGFAVSIDGGENAVKFKKILEPHGRDGLNIAELGVGTNYSAKLCGSILEDEKVGGTVHIALGNNASMGGNFTVGVHIDCVMINPTLEIDGKVILKEGKFA